MDTKQLEYFFEIIKYGSFTAAASHLYTNQSTVSRKISELENELGAELFKRNSRVLELTDAGKLFYEEGQEILKRINTLYHKIENISSGRMGQIVIGMAFNVLGLHEKRVLRALRKEYGDLQLSLVSMSLDEIMVAIENGTIDAAITFDHAAKQLPEWVVKEHFFSDRLAFIVSDEDEVCAKEYLVMEDFYSKPLVLPKSLKPIHPEFITKILLQAKEKQVPEPIFCNNHESMIMEVSLGHGIGVLPRLLVDRNPAHSIKSLKVKDIDDSMDYVILYNAKKAKPGMENFVRKCIEIMNS